jgi:hypothetical protein
MADSLAATHYAHYGHYGGHYEDGIRIAQFRSPQPAPDLRDQNRSGPRRRTASCRPHGSMSFRGFDPEWSSTAEGGARIGRRQAPVFRRVMRAPLTGSKPRKNGGFQEVDGAPRQALGAKGQRAFCCRDADKFFASGEGRAILVSSPATGRSGGGRPRFRRSAAVKEGSGKLLKLQSAPSSKGLTRLDRT